MSLELHEVTTDAEFALVCAVETEAFNDPYFGFWLVFYGSASQEEFCARQLSWHKDDPSSHWIYVKDVETGCVIGGAQWNVYKENPYAIEAPMLSPYWLPEGAFKDVASQLLHSFLSYRPKRLNEAHMLLNFCFTHPKHRRRGVGRLLMDWGTKMADELGLPCYIEATEFGLGFYEAHGFKIAGDIDLDAASDSPSEEFNSMRQKLGCPVHGWFMWRPKYGNVE